MTTTQSRKQGLLPGERLSIPLAGAAEATGISEDVISRAIKAGLLRTRYPSSRAVIRVADLDAWLDDLPLDKPE